MKDWPDNCVDLVLTDPPYGIGIAEWDIIDNYTEWFILWAKLIEKLLRNNGTFWFFHMLFPVLANIHNQLVQQTSFCFKQWITIDKGLQSVVNRSMEKMRSFPRASEYLLFYKFNDLTGAQQLSDKYAKVNPMAKYLREEFLKANITNGQIAELFPSRSGGMTGCVSNWLLGYNFPTQGQYEKMREFFKYKYLRKEYEDLRKEYEDLRKEYEYLRKEYEYLRYTFNLPKGVTDVWPINFYGNINEGHPTIKPLDLMCRIINTTSSPADLILDPFCGSGTTCVAAKMLGRNYIGIDISEEYCKIARMRIKAVDTGVPVKEQLKGQMGLFDNST